MAKVTKISLARALYHAVTAANAESHRKAFIEQYNKLHVETFGVEAKPTLAQTYHQMIKYEVEGKAGGAYRHHKGKKKAEVTESPAEPIAIVIPEGAKWKVVGETTEYFTNREAAREFKRHHGGALEKVA